MDSNNLAEQAMEKAQVSTQNSEISIPATEESIPEQNKEQEEKDKTRDNMLLPLVVKIYDNHTYAVFEDVEFTWHQGSLLDRGQKRRGWTV